MAEWWCQLIFICVVSEKLEMCQKTNKIYDFILLKLIRYVILKKGSIPYFSDFCINKCVQEIFVIKFIAINLLFVSHHGGNNST